METLAQAINRLSDAGYVEHFYPNRGLLVCGRCETDVDPSAVRVDEIVRFEGASDPDDQAILYALSGACGHLGVYSAPYGAAARSDDVGVLLALPNVSS